MRTRIQDFVKSLFRRQKQQDVKQPEAQVQPPKKGGSFAPTRQKPPGRWIITVNRIHREHSNKIRRRRKTNKMGRKSRQINRRKAA